MSPVPKATGYKVFRSTDDSWNSPAVGTAADLTFADQSFTPGVTYFYKVAAYNAKGTGPMSTAATVTPTVATATPTGLAATPGNGMVTLSWTPVATAASYNVYRGTATGAQSATAIASGLTTSALVDAGLANGTTYFYKVTAVGPGGESARSTEASATRFAPLLAPTGVAAAPGDTTVSLSWLPVPTHFRTASIAARRPAPKVRRPSRRVSRSPRFSTPPGATASRTSIR
jgi:hypothetical protein